MIGGKVLEAIELENTKTHERWMVADTGGLFYDRPPSHAPLGCQAKSHWMSEGFIKTGALVAKACRLGKAMDRSPGPLENELARNFLLRAMFALVQ